MPKRTLLVVLLALAGCSPSVTTARSTTPVADVSAAEVASREETNRLLRERIRELEAALGLARAEARELRAELTEARAAERARVTRIGTREQAAEPIVPEAPPSEGPRPVLRLYGSPPASATPALQGPTAPPIVAAPPPAGLRLPVTPGEEGVPVIPPVPVAVAPSIEPPVARTPSAPAPAEDGAVRAYRAALAHLTARRLDDALAGLDAFLRDHPRHPYADNAQYWRGEIHYARRDYRRAIAELTALMERFPRGNKTPDALLRIGQCHERLGERDRARQVFRRLRTEFPESVAARTAPREDV